MTKLPALGTITTQGSNRRTDYLYRISLKGLIRNDKGEVLVVKESGRDWWDLPGGGMDHGEDLCTALAREMREEVNLSGDFSYRIVSTDQPDFLTAHNLWQLRLVFEITPVDPVFSAGEDSDEIAFMSPEVFKDSEREVERRIYKHASIAELAQA